MKKKEFGKKNEFENNYLVKKKLWFERKKNSKEEQQYK